HPRARAAADRSLRRARIRPARSRVAALRRQSPEGRTRAGVLRRPGRASRRVADARSRRRGDRDRTLVPARRGLARDRCAADQRGPRRDPRARRSHRRDVRRRRRRRAWCGNDDRRRARLAHGRRRGKDVMRIERRLQQPRWLSLVVPLVSLVVAFVAATVILLVTHHPPLHTFRRLFDAAFLANGALTETVVSATPL